jgi:archaellum component FlaC
MNFMPDQHLKDKVKILLEEKSLLEDEIVSIAALARNYQAQAKSCKEELEKLEASYKSICMQNSLLESDLIRLNNQVQEIETENHELKIQVLELTEKISLLQDLSSGQDKSSQSLLMKNNDLNGKIKDFEALVKQLNEECEELRNLCSEKNDEIMTLQELVDKDRKNNAIKELSYIILSKEHSCPDSPMKIIKNNHLITEVFENKIRSLEQESQEFLCKYRSVLLKYIDCLKEFRDHNKKVSSYLKGENPFKEEIILAKSNYLEIEIEFSEYELEKLECEEISYYTSFGESPAADLETRKSRSSGVSMGFLLAQAAMIESLLQSNTS